MKIDGFKSLDLSLLMAVLSVALLHGPSYCGALRASAVKINITPDADARLTLDGYPREDKMRGINDSLYLRILALDDGQKKAYLVSADLSATGDEYYESIIEKLERETPIRRKELLLTSTHTHSGPLVELDGENPEYSMMVRERLIEGLQEASQTLEPARIGMDFGRSFMNMNRRAWYPGKKMYLGRNPYKTVDREFGAVRVEREDGSLMAVAVNYACHGTALFLTNFFVSGDAQGTVSRYLEQELGDGVIALYLNGAAGDVDPLYSYVDSPRFHHFDLDMLGIMLGKDVLELLPGIRTTPDAEINTFQETVTVPRKESQISEHGRSTAFLVSILRINDIVFSASSGEVFNQIGINIKQMSPYAKTMFVGYCNGYSGYLPTKAAFSEGGYEIRVTHTTEDAEWLFTQSVVEMLRNEKAMRRYYGE